MPVYSTLGGVTGRLVIARSNKHNQLRTKPIDDHTFLMQLPKDYELTKKITVDGKIIPSHGDFIVYYIDDPKQTEELLELVQLRASSPITNALFPTTRALPPPPPEENLENLKFMENMLDEEDEDNTTGYRHVIIHMHSMITNSLSSFVNGDGTEDKKPGIQFLESLGRPSPFWEERAKDLLIEEQRVLQELVKEIRGGWSFFRFHVSSKIRVGDYERLVVAAMAEAIKSPSMKAYHMIAYDVNIEHYVHGRPGEYLLPQMEHWILPPKSLDNDSFRIDSHWVTRSRKHPMQCLDELGERFFRKIIDTNQSGEILYTRAVLCRSLLITYFFQSFLNVWDDCLLNGHLEAMRGVIPPFPKIMDRLREHTRRGSCPREGRPELRTTPKLLTMGEDGAKNADFRTDTQQLVARVTDAEPEDVEMVDAEAVSDHSSDTIIGESKAQQAQSASKPSKKSKKGKRADKRRLARNKQALATLDAQSASASKTEEALAEATATEATTTKTAEEEITPASNDDMAEAGVSQEKDKMDTIQSKSQSLLDDLVVKMEDEAEKPSIVTSSLEGNEVTQRDEGKATVTQQVSSSSVAPISKSKAKKLRRKARAANQEALDKIANSSTEITDTAAQVSVGAKPDTPTDHIEAATDVSNATPIHSKSAVKDQEGSQKQPQNSNKQKSETMARRRKTGKGSGEPKAVPGATLPNQPDVPPSSPPKPLSEPAPKSEGEAPEEVPKKKDPLYDNDEDIKAAIEASCAEPSSWTTVGANKKMTNQTSQKPHHNNSRVNRGPNPSGGSVRRGLQPRAPRGDARPQAAPQKNAPPQKNTPKTPLAPPPAAAAAKAPTPTLTNTKKEEPKGQENERPARRKTSKSKRQQRLPVLADVVEFPTLAQSSLMLHQGKTAHQDLPSTSLTGQNFMDPEEFDPFEGIGKTENHKVDDVAQPTPKAKASGSPRDVAKLADYIESKQKAAEESRHEIKPARAEKVETGSAKKKKPVIVPEDIVDESKVQKSSQVKVVAENVASTQPDKESVHEEDVVKQTDSKEVTMITESDSPAKEAPSSDRSTKSSLLVLEEKIPFKSLTKKERKAAAAAKAAAEGKPTQKLSVKERAALRRSDDEKAAARVRALPAMTAEASVPSTSVAASPSDVGVKILEDTQLEVPSTQSEQISESVPREVTKDVSSKSESAPSLNLEVTQSVEVQEAASVSENIASMPVVEAAVPITENATLPSEVEHISESKHDSPVALEADITHKDDDKVEARPSNEAKVEVAIEETSQVEESIAQSQTQTFVTKPISEGPYEENNMSTPTQVQSTGAVNTGDVQENYQEPQVATANLLHPETIRAVQSNFHLLPSYVVDRPVDVYANRREEIRDFRQLMFATVPGDEIGTIPPEHVYPMAGMSRHVRTEQTLLRLWDVKRPRQPSLVIHSPRSVKEEDGKVSTVLGLIAIECPANRRYSFDSLTVAQNHVQPESVSEEERTYARNPDGHFVTEGTFYTTDNSTPGRIFHITSPRFVPGRALKADGTEAGYQVIDTHEVSGAPISFGNLFYQCSNRNCGRRIAAEVTVGCAKCGCCSTTRYCSNFCQWNDLEHWKICGKASLVEGNVSPKRDYQRVLNARQTFVPANVDGWRQQVAHVTGPGSYTLFMVVNDGQGESYKHTYQVGFSPGWEGNSFAFLTRLAIDLGHVSAVRLLFRWIKRQIKRKAPVAWSDGTFFSFVQAVYHQLVSEFGDFWARGEDFWGLDDMSAPGILDELTLSLMYKEGWRVIEQDVPGFIRPHGFWFPSRNMPASPAAAQRGGAA
ncbi:hypothetical protein TWF696_000559 [Orbilia brochopaga]|uniref:MYND-type domain-containing protein n=1 Tax=Orbilia brochopaga TaxID=3140254 RepID=A0AAV9VED2_9PEZI